MCAAVPGAGHATRRVTVVCQQIINAAATMHLAHSTLPYLMVDASDCTNMNTIETGQGPVREDRGVSGTVMRASDEPGLGVEPFMEILGAPVAEHR